MGEYRNLVVAEQIITHLNGQRQRAVSRSVAETKSGMGRTIDRGLKALSDLHQREEIDNRSPGLPICVHLR